MNETQYKPGDLVKHRRDGDRGIVVEVPRTHAWVSVYWFQDGKIISESHDDYLQLLARGHSND